MLTARTLQKCRLAMLLLYRPASISVGLSGCVSAITFIALSLIVWSLVCRFDANQISEFDHSPGGNMSTVVDKPENATVDPIETDGRTFCAIHTSVETTLRCNKCGRYMCVKCAVRTPVGYRCKQCV